MRGVSEPLTYLLTTTIGPPPSSLNSAATAVSRVAVQGVLNDLSSLLPPTSTTPSQTPAQSTTDADLLPKPSSLPHLLLHARNAQYNPRVGVAF